jgi:hypothetical protein
MFAEPIPAFFSAVKARQEFINEFETLYARKLAIGFNALDFVAWNENKVSQILAFFLNPNEGHCQGDVYLQIFLSELGLSFNYLEKSSVSVRVEETTDLKRRVDIVLSNKDGTQVLGIENKIYPWTADQKDQVKDYLDYLQAFYPNASHQLVFLAPKSKMLTEYSAGVNLAKWKNEGRLVIINYEEHLIKLIGHFILHTENERVKCFLEDFRRKLTEKYIGNENLDGRTMLAKFINETEENLKIAFAVSNSLNGLKEQLKVELTDQMAEAAKELHLSFDQQYGHFELPNLKNCYVKYNFEEGGVIYGLVKKPAFYSVHPDRISQPELVKHLGIKFRSSLWWPLYFKQYADIETDDKLWVDIRNKQFSRFMKKFIVQIKELSPHLTKGL